MQSSYILLALSHIDYTLFGYNKTNNTHEIYMGECLVLNIRSCEKK